MDVHDIVMVKREPLENDAFASSTSLEPYVTSLGHRYTIYDNPSQVAFNAESALSECMHMTEAVGECIAELNQEVSTGGARQEDWTRSLRQLRDSARQTTMIAVYGDTGRGKSSLINAILDMPIVPSDGAQACTSVITEIAWHEDPTLLAKIVFLSEKEWADELAPLLQDLNDIGNGPIEDEDTEAAWAKLWAVYHIDRAGLKNMASVTDLVRSNPAVFSWLGESKAIKETDKGMFTDKVQQYIGAARKSMISDAYPTPELWPLIKVVKIYCRSPALSSGSILVDLPGTADTNRARASIATKYVKECDHVWVVMDITRAVNDKNAKELMEGAVRMQLFMDGSYDSGRITLIASKTDQVSPSEVLNGYDLASDETGLKQIVERERECNTELREVQARLDLIRSTKTCTETTASSSANGKRRNSVSDLDHGASKKARILPNQHSTVAQSSAAVMAYATQSQQEELMEIIASARSSTTTTPPKNIQDDIDQNEVRQMELKYELTQLVREKRVLCSRQRSKESAPLMKRNFVQKVKELEEAAAEARDPDNFDPSVPLRDYSHIDPPIFPCSALGYIRIQGLVEGDGEPYCFSDPESTGIPQLQEWCRTIGRTRRKDSYPGLMSRLETLASSIHSYAEAVDTDDVADADSEVMKARWQSP
ncbi:hypothetical protein DAEQUDRAFT_152267 [Daedalea quercina L-15889]|uniref:Dynamin N-terminal domain-containing protein n=1 Tax=Daedalea quercina L-15889 TaxID=1314783 RepID=A0A165RLQ7_9APHY|nr:hypothetical protein DAEQUDRAFT_152267 [Daedalea quercina L-15889]